MMIDMPYIETKGYIAEIKPYKIVNGNIFGSSFFISYIPLKKLEFLTFK